LPIAAIMIVFTAFMAYEAQFVRMSYKFGGILPKDDSTYIEYENFVKQFSEDGNVLVIGYRDPAIWKLENFTKWKQLGSDLKKVQVSVEGQQKNSVDSIFSTAHCYTLLKDTANQRFRFEQLAKQMPSTQEEVDSIRNRLYSLPFYQGLLFNDSTDAGLMMVFVNSELFNSEDRGNAVEQIVNLCNKFTEDTGVKTYLSGLPFIRTEMMTKIKAELKYFTALSALICMLLLYIFFRSVKVMVVVMTVVVVAVVVAMGSIALFDYPITALMGLMPPLMIVTCVPNCIYLVTKYHQEYQRYGNKTRALARVVQKAGAAAFMINATTAVG
jgi:predicted RND superfamily exporter protein